MYFLLHTQLNIVKDIHYYRFQVTLFQKKLIQLSYNGKAILSTFQCSILYKEFTAKENRLDLMARLNTPVNDSICLPFIYYATNNSINGGYNKNSAKHYNN